MIALFRHFQKVGVDPVQKVNFNHIMNASWLIRGRGVDRSKHSSFFTSGTNARSEVNLMVSMECRALNRVSEAFAAFKSTIANIFVTNGYCD